jgi:hypothetical protein
LFARKSPRSWKDLSDNRALSARRLFFFFFFLPPFLWMAGV